MRRPGLTRAPSAPQQRLRDPERGERQDHRRRHQRHRRAVVPELHVAEDRQGQRLGLARDVAGDHDRGAELAQRAAESERRGGEQPAAGERQRDREEAAQRAEAERARHRLEPRVHLLERQPRGAHDQRQGHDRRGQHRSLPGEQQVEVEAQGPLAERSVAGQQAQQQIADGGRRQDQRQRGGRFDQRLSRHVAAREEPPQRDSRDEDRERRAQGDPDAQAEGDESAVAHGSALRTTKP